MAKGGLYDPKIEPICSFVPESDNLCIYCNEKGANKCSRCGVAKYCSRNCQRLDWPIHKRVCHNWIAEPPSTKHFRVVVFRALTNKIDFLWATNHPHGFEVDDKEVEEIRDLTLLAGFLKDLRPDASHHGCLAISSGSHVLQGRKVGHGLAHFSPVNRFTTTDVELRWINKSVAGLGPPGHMKPVAGPLVFLSFVPTPGKSKPVAFRHATMRDARHAVDVLQGSDTNHCVVDPARFVFNRIPAIKLNIIKRPNRLFSALGVTKDIEAVSVIHEPASLELAGNQLACIFAFEAGLRWYIRAQSQIYHEPEPGMGPFAWAAATVKADDFPGLHYVAWLGQQYNSDTGSKLNFGDAGHVPSIMVIHATGAALHPSHVNAFMAYYELHVARHGQPGRSWQRPNRGDFSVFWENYKAQMGHVLAEVPSPYEFEKPNSNLEDAHVGSYGGTAEEVMEALRVCVAKAFGTI